MKKLKKATVFFGLALCLGAFAACENTTPATEETESESMEDSNMEDTEMMENATMNMDADTSKAEGEHPNDDDTSDEHPN